MNSTPDLDLAAIKARAEAATPGPWCWQGNIDTGEPYLASRTPGMGTSVLAIGSEDRATTGRAADDVREYASDSGLDPDDEVEQWATDRYGEPIQDPRLWFYTDHMAVDARKRVTFEVAPNATHRDDPRVYRADIAGIRHPDAEFIAAARADVSALIAEVERLRDQATSAWAERMILNVHNIARQRDEARAELAAERERIALAIEGERLFDDTGTREDEAYNDAINLAARIARGGVA